jgi:hypothetical protein
MKLRALWIAAMLVLWAGNALAGRACPSDVASGSGAISEKVTHPAHAAAATHVNDPAIAAPAAMPAHTVANPGCCSMPFSSAGDVVTASGVTAASHAAPAENAATAHAAAKCAPAKPVSRVPQRSAVAPAFGPLFLAHQALML